MKFNKNKLILFLILLSNLLLTIYIIKSKYNGTYEINIFNNIILLFPIIIINMIGISYFIIKKCKIIYILLSFCSLLNNLLNIPLYKNYYFFNNADPATYYGLISDIINNHVISNYYFYPNTFILFNNIFTIIGLHNYFLYCIISFIIYLIFLIILLYYGNISYKLKIFALILMGSIIYTKYLYPITPLFLSFIILILIIKIINNRNDNKSLLLFFSFSILLFHPFTTLILILYLLTNIKSNKILIYFNSFIFLFWTMIIFNITRNFIKIFNNIFIFGSSEIYEKSTSSASLAISEYGLFEIIKYFFINYYLLWLILILLLYIIFEVYKNYKNINKYEILNIFKFKFIIVFLLIFSFLIIIFNLILNDFIRVIIFILPIIFLIISLLYFNNKNIKKRILLLSIILLFVSNIIGLFTLYNTPYNFGYNRLITEDQIYLIEYMNNNDIIIKESNIYVNTINIERLYDLKYGPQAKINNAYFNNNKQGYYKNNLDNITNGYIIYYDLDKQIYDEIYTKTKFINDNTIDNLNKDFDNIYNSGEIKIFYI